MKHGNSFWTGSSGGVPGATDWSVRGNGGNTIKRRPGMEHPGRKEARHKPPDWIVRGCTRRHGLERQRQRREYDKKMPRSGVEHNPGPRTGSSRREPGTTDWSVQGKGENTIKRGDGTKHDTSPRTGLSMGEPGAMGWSV